MPVHNLAGLKAMNPLGFMAALGLLRILDDKKPDGSDTVRLGFTDGCEPHARVDTSLEFDEVIDCVLNDAESQQGCPALRLAYTKTGEEVAPTSPKAVRDLKPTPAHARRYLKRMATASRRASDLAAGFFSELVQQGTNADRSKPTALHFTAGQQTFLSMVEELRTGMTSENVEEALRGPWRGESLLPSLAWDAAGARQYALRAKNPSTEKRGSVAAANWLAVHSLAFFPVVVKQNRLLTSCVTGGWKDSVFRWPVWNEPLSPAATAALLRCDFGRMKTPERAAVGISGVLQAEITRSDQGGYGSFSPPTFA